MGQRGRAPQELKKLEELFHQWQERLPAWVLFKMSKKKDVYPALARIDQDDMLQVGRMALWHACLKFDPARASFSTYATSAIWHAYLHELKKFNRGGQHHRQPIDEDSEEDVAAIPDFVPELLTQDEWNFLLDKVKEFPNRDIGLLRRRFVRGWTIIRLAKFFGTNRDSIKRRLKKLLAMLACEMGEPRHLLDWLDGMNGTEDKKPDG